MPNSGQQTSHSDLGFKLPLSTKKIKILQGNIWVQGWGGKYKMSLKHSLVSQSCQRMMGTRQKDADANLKGLLLAKSGTIRASKLVMVAGRGDACL